MPNINGNFSETREKLSKIMRGLGPEIELDAQAELITEIQELKKSRNAIILGHNYMEPALYHSVTDVVGDSLQLARSGLKTDAQTIVFCGVEFMAETAKILSPEKTVLIPSQKAGCSLASSITAEDIRVLRKTYPGIPIISYINTYAEVKAEVDVCCTSGNALQVVESFDTDQVIFVPDEYLAKNIAKESNKTILIPQKLSNGTIQADNQKADMIGWPGKCEVHDQFKPQDIIDVKKQYPNVQVLAHPECPPEVTALADYSGSTSKMIDYVKQHPNEKILLLTECSMGDNIIAETGNDAVLRLCQYRCPHMGQITLEQTRDALKFNRYRIELPKELMDKARGSIERMLAI